jgi:glycosyltransferase involved in cell wall biosynthesis
MISPQFRPLIGGYEKAAERLAISIADRGHHVQIVSEQRDRSWPKFEQIGQASLLRLWCIFKPGVHKFTSLFSLAVFLITRGWRYDVWHVHQYGDYAGLAILIGKLFRRPVIFKVTSSGPLGLRPVIAKTRLPKINRFLHTRAAGVAALTVETQAEAIEFGVAPERVHLIGNGVDVRRFRPADADRQHQIRGELGLANQNYAIYSGRFSEPKNTLGLVKAWQHALPSLPSSWDLIMLGDGPEWQDVYNYCHRNQLLDRVHLVGQQQEVEKWLQIAKINLLSSWNEGLSNSLLEAMACGLPTVATRVSGVFELIEQGQAGLAVPIGDMDAFGNAILTLAMNNKLREEAGEKARKIIEERFSLASNTAAYERLYLKLCKLETNE